MIDKMVYDVLILGGGPVGCFAAYLANDKGLKTVLVESTNQLGGQPINLFAQKNITDYPGFASINAKQLVDNLVNQLKHHDEIDIFLNKQLISFKNQNGICNFAFNDGLIIETKFLIIATGNGSFFPNLLQIPGSENNKKLHYIVQPYEEYNDKKVIILGGGDSAVDWANNLANKTTANISIIHRRDIFRANGENVKLLSKNNVDILLNKECLKINDNILFVKDNLSKIEESISFDNIIIQYGQKINNTLIEPILKNVEHNVGNKIIVNRNQQTNIDNIYAIGNACTYMNRPNMIITGHGEAAVAINDIITKIKKYDEHKTF